MIRTRRARRCAALLAAALLTTTFACGGDDAKDATGPTGTDESADGTSSTAGDGGSSATPGADDHCSLMTNAEMRKIAKAASVSSQDTTSGERIVFCRFEFGVDDDALEDGNAAYVDVGLTAPRRGNDNAEEEMTGFLHCGGQYSGSDEVVACETIEGLGDSAQIAESDGSALVGVIRSGELLEVEVQGVGDPAGGVTADSRTIAEQVARLAFGRLPAA